MLLDAVEMDAEREEIWVWARSVVGSDWYPVKREWVLEGGPAVEALLSDYFVGD